MKDLAGKVAVITGAGSGIGRGMARAFAGAGMHVVVADVELDAAEAVASELNGTAIRVDVTKPGDVQALADQVYRQHGAVHLLCNNAGVALAGPLSDMTHDDWRWVLSVNIEGVANCLTTFLPRMKAQGGEAHIVNTGSIAGFITIPEGGIYAATKYAVVAISETLRGELAPHNIGVTVICPGSVRTNILGAARNRPDELKDTTVEAPAAFSDPVGMMDPDQVGLEVRDAVIANALYSIPLTDDNKVLIPMVQARFDAIMKAMP
jgi:NAD(P)-dependent dehydrogenase (short-subunit alcohol dehydrogenase family)